MQGTMTSDLEACSTAGSETGEECKNLFVVERNLDKRMGGGGKTESLLKWKDYGEEENIR